MKTNASIPARAAKADIAEAALPADGIATAVTPNSRARVIAAPRPRPLKLEAGLRLSSYAPLRGRPGRPACGRLSFMHLHGNARPGLPATNTEDHQDDEDDSGKWQVEGPHRVAQPIPMLAEIVAAGRQDDAPDRGANEGV